MCHHSSEEESDRETRLIKESTVEIFKIKTGNKWKLGFKRQLQRSHYAHAVCYASPMTTFVAVVTLSVSTVPCCLLQPELHPSQVGTEYIKKLVYIYIYIWLIWSSAIDFIWLCPSKTSSVRHRFCQLWDIFTSRICHYRKIADDLDYQTFHIWLQ